MMSFRGKLLLALTLVVVVSVGLVSWAVTTALVGSFEELDAQRTQALAGQFRREFSYRAAEVARRIDDVARAESVVRLAVDLSQPGSDPSIYFNTAQEQAAAHRLEFLEFVAADGSVISSAHWAARFGYKNTWILQAADSQSDAAQLQKVDLPGGVELGLIAVRQPVTTDPKLWVIGGQRADAGLLATLSLPAGMRAFLYANLESAFSPGALLATSGPFGQAEKLAPLIEETRLQRRECSGVVDWRDGGNGTEQFHTIPLFGRGEELLAVLLVGSSRDELLSLKRFILRLALAASAGGIFLGLLVSAWITKRVSHPVRQLAESARRVAAGQWDTRVRFQSRDEIGQLADAFNRMTQQLSEQRDKLIQAERVAAWRELARRLAHELKNPLFPLQITVENLERAKQHHPKQFDEVFRESTATLTAELSNLKTIISRFSDFSRMPPPQIEPVDINSIVQQVLRLFDAQFQAVEAVVVHPQVKLDETLCPIEADPDQIKRALQNLVLNALDAMPSGGTLTVETHGQDEQVEIKVSDTGAGLTSEERERIFTPYYTSKQHGTGLGLAIVQAVVSDHGGKVSVASQPGRGTTFCMTIPVRPKVQT